MHQPLAADEQHNRRMARRIVGDRSAFQRSTTQNASSWGLLGVPVLQEFHAHVSHCHGGGGCEMNYLFDLVPEIWLRG